MTFRLEFALHWRSVQSDEGDDVSRQSSSLLVLVVRWSCSHTLEDGSLVSWRAHRLVCTFVYLFKLVWKSGSRTIDVRQKIRRRETRDLNSRTHSPEVVDSSVRRAA